MKALRELSTVTKRLFLLTVAAAALAIPAVAGCTPYYLTCPDGTQTGATVCCPSGMQSGADCTCTGWTPGGGFTGCSVTTVCYDPNAT